MAVEFSYETFAQSIASGGSCIPPGVYAPFFRVDKKAYDTLHKMLLKKGGPVYDPAPLRKRFGDTLFNNIRGAVELSMRMAQSYFPAYHFFMEEFLRDEWLAAVDWHKAFHRDHVLHQPMVAHLGMELLAEKLQKGLLFPGRKTLLDLCVETILFSEECAYLREYLRRTGVPKRFLPQAAVQETGPKKHPMLYALWRPLVRDAFFLAAMFHDLGYPWQFINNIINKLGPHSPLMCNGSEHADTLGYSLEKIFYTGNVKDTLYHLKNRLLLYPFRGYKHPELDTPWPHNGDLEQLFLRGVSSTHGLPGALAFLYLNDRLRDKTRDSAPKKRPVRQFCVEWAALAIMMHDFSKMYMNDKISGNDRFRVCFKRDPLSFVLTLCDIMQDFSRPDVSFADGQSDGFRGAYQKRCGKVTVDIKKKRFDITFYYAKLGDYVQQKYQFKPGDEESFLDTEKGYLDFTGTGITQASMHVERLP